MLSYVIQCKCENGLNVSEAVNVIYMQIASFHTGINMK